MATVSDIAHQTQYLYFVEVADSGKTKTWDVLSVSGGYRLGQVKWFGRWRQYTFHPDTETVWNTTCLKDVTAFIEKQMLARRG